MNKLLYIMPIMVFGFSWYLKWTGDMYYSVCVFVMSIFMWLAVFGNELKNNNKNQDYGNDQRR